MTQRVTVSREGLTLDMLLVIHMGFGGQTLVAEALDLNPGLAGLGSELPLKTVVLLPDAPLPAETAAQVTVVDLFS